MSNATVVYYTSNMDYPVLEESVRKTIRENAGGLPIISVSHKPLDFGENICVGETERTLQNIYKQMRLGAMRAKTQFVVMCEADFLYPKKWFEFTPDRGDTYYYPRDGWLAYQSRDYYFSKVIHQLTGIIDRVHLLGLLDLLRHSDPAIRPARFIQKHSRTEEFDAGNVVTIKTDRQMHDRSPHRDEGKRESLHEWGPWSSFVEEHFE